MSNHSPLYINNSMLAVVEGLRDNHGTLIEDGTVVVTDLVTKSGVQVGGIILPLTMDHVGEGRYEAVIPPLSVPQGLYYATIRATYNGMQGEWTETLVAQRRQA